MACCFFLIAVLSGLVAFIIFLSVDGHKPIGVIHGKIGLIAIFLASLHILNRIKWVKRKQNRNTFTPVINTSLCAICGLCVKICPVQVFF